MWFKMFSNCLADTSILILLRQKWSPNSNNAKSFRKISLEDANLGRLIQKTDMIILGIKNKKTSNVDNISFVYYIEIVRKKAFYLLLS